MLLLLDDHKYINIPYGLMPSSIHNRGNYIISLGELCKWMAERAQEMGVEIYTGFSGDEVF
jgi:electron-transferring-flavoprotein dehydrogenase